MNQKEPTVLEVRNRIEDIEDDIYRHAFMYQFLIGGEPSEACGKYAPNGNDAFKVDFIVRGKNFPAIAFVVKTARREGIHRICALPLDPKFEPWAQPVFDWFKKHGEKMPFEFGHIHSLNHEDDLEKHAPMHSSHTQRWDKWGLNTPRDDDVDGVATIYGCV